MQGMSWLSQTTAKPFIVDEVAMVKKRADDRISWGPPKNKKKSPFLQSKRY